MALNAELKCFGDSLSIFGLNQHWACSIFQTSNGIIFSMKTLYGMNAIETSKHQNMQVQGTDPVIILFVTKFYLYDFYRSVVGRRRRL